MKILLECPWNIGKLCNATSDSWWEILNLYIFSILNSLLMFLCAACRKGQLGFTGQTFISMDRENKSIKNCCFTHFPNKTINYRPLFCSNLPNSTLAINEDCLNPVTSQINSALWSHHISLIFLSVSTVRENEMLQKIQGAKREMKIQRNWEGCHDCYQPVRMLFCLCEVMHVCVCVGVCVCVCVCVCAISRVNRLSGFNRKGLHYRFFNSLMKIWWILFLVL